MNETTQVRRNREAIADLLSWPVERVTYDRVTRRYTATPPPHSMTTEEAYRLVIADQRESYPEMTEDEAIQHVFETISLDDVNTYGAIAPHDDDPIAEAYRIVLTHER